MNKKEALIHKLKNELRGGESNMKYFDCTVEEAKEVLKKIETGYYDELLNSIRGDIDLHYFIKYDLATKNLLTTKPSIKEYRIHCIREDLNREVEYSFDATIEDLKKYKEKVEKLFVNLRAGVYDELLIGQGFWFENTLDALALLEWDLIREKNNIKDKPTFPNYIVFSTYYKIMDHVERVNTWKDTFNCYYHSRLTYHEQTPTTKDELERYKALGDELVNRNYDWREARNVKREFQKLKIFDHYEFPHNVEEVIKAFEPNQNIVFKEFEGRGNCCHELEEIQTKASCLLELLNENNLEKIYLNREEDKVDEYLRKMITSQFDVELLCKKSYSISQEEIKKVLENPKNYSDYEIKNLFSRFPLQTRKMLYHLAFGILYSLSAFQKGDHVNLYEDAINMQKALGCFCGTIYYNNYNSCGLSNGSRIYSIPYEDIESRYSSFQQEYDYYLSNSTSDLEYIEGCTEIAGNVITSQIFMEGNKRTTKCLFNAMLVIRGIVPPILDFCNTDLNLWEKFACNCDNKYIPAKKEILEETLKIAAYFDSNSKNVSASSGYIKK